MDEEMKILKKFEKLKKNLKQLNNACIAFSGGVDSTFLLFALKEALGNNALAVTVSAMMHSQEEIKEARKIAKQIGIKHIVVEIPDDDLGDIIDNSKNRCYICKKKIFSSIIDIAKENNIQYIIEGTNIDDLDDYRPGIKALEELKVVSPLKDAGLTKNEIRILSKKVGLPTFNKPAFSCLATRIPTNEKLTRDKLERVEKAEIYLRKLGFDQLRVRVHGDIARIEIDRDSRRKMFNEDLLDKISKELKSYGFRFVAMELEGYKMGNMN